MTTASTLLWRIRQFSRRIWVRITLISALALFVAAIAGPVGRTLPTSLGWSIDEEAVSRLLSILSNSMLAVTTFSLSVMVTAHNAAANTATPRVHRLLREDTRTHVVLATFIGAFLYALLSITLLNADLVGQEAYWVLYGATILVIVLVVVAILRWIDHLTSLGSLDQAVARIEEVARDALSQRAALPLSGAHVLPSLAERQPITARIEAEQFGYIQHMDMARLSELAEAIGGTIHFLVAPGAWVTPTTVLADVQDGTPDPEQRAQIRSACVIGEWREFQQDPGLGIEVLAEIGIRALSPGINDPQTAVDVTRRLGRLLWSWQDEAGEGARNTDAHVGAAVDGAKHGTTASTGETSGDAKGDAPDTTLYPRLTLPPWSADAAVQAAYGAIAREGAAQFEVQAALQSALSYLASQDGPMAKAARIQSADALAYAEGALVLDSERSRLRDMAAAVARGALT